jgi:hypothetical protein
LPLSYSPIKISIDTGKNISTLPSESTATASIWPFSDNVTFLGVFWKQSGKRGAFTLLTTYKNIVFQLVNLIKITRIIENFILINYISTVPQLRVKVLNATFNNISDILWRSNLLVEETGVPGPQIYRKSLTNFIT